MSVIIENKSRLGVEVQGTFDPYKPSVMSTTGTAGVPVKTNQVFKQLRMVTGVELRP